MATYDPPAGTHIRRACAESVKLANECNEPVPIKFNDIDLIANPGDDPSALEVEWNRKSAERHQEYIKSDAYKDYQEKRRREASANQFIVDTLISGLPNVDTEAAWMRWASDLAGAADDCAVKLDHRGVADVLTGRGWIMNQHVGRKPEEIESNKTIMSQYIMGQVIECLRMGMPPRPITQTFVEKYFAVK